MVCVGRRKLFGLIGGFRSGKDVVADFLEETRGFKKFAFADKIKLEAGISKEDFEFAKVSGKIEEVRQRLWQFSSEKTKTDPLYFIKPVMMEAFKHDSAAITDIRTVEELKAFFEYDGDDDRVKRIYLLTDENLKINTEADTGFLVGSKIEKSLLLDLESQGALIKIPNSKQGLFGFMCYLDKLFVREDLVDLVGSITGNSFNSDIREMLSIYLNNFSVSGVKNEKKLIT